MALAAIGALWAGVLWVILTPPPKVGLASAPSPEVAGQAQTPQPEAATRAPQRAGLRALAMAGGPGGLNGRFGRFRPELVTMALASHRRGGTAFSPTLRAGQPATGAFLRHSPRESAR